MECFNCLKQRIPLNLPELIMQQQLKQPLSLPLHHHSTLLPCLNYAQIQFHAPHQLQQKESQYLLEEQ